MDRLAAAGTSDIGWKNSYPAVAAESNRVSHVCLSGYMLLSGLKRRWSVGTCTELLAQAGNGFLLALSGPVSLPEEEHEKQQSGQACKIEYEQDQQVVSRYDCGLPERTGVSDDEQRQPKSESKQPENACEKNLPKASHSCLLGKRTSPLRHNRIFRSEGFGGEIEESPVFA